MAKKLTQEEFISRCKNLFGDRFSYEKTHYVNNITKVVVTDKDGNDISILPCNLKRFKQERTKYTTETFIKRANEVHGYRYEYGKCICNDAHDKVIITCPKHGDFVKAAYAHIQGQGCPICGNRYNTEKFIEKARKIHGGKYDYSQTNYKNNSTKICIICPDHGEFWQTPNEHLRGNGCPLCAKIMNENKAKEGFFEKANKVHGNKYDYSKTEYVNSQTKVCIICPEHGEFWQTPLHHLSGQGCPICARKKSTQALVLTQEEFLKKAKSVHDDKYDYSQAVYNGWDVKMKIICKKHGIFLQTPHSHIGNACGCPKCHLSHAEIQIEKKLKKENIAFEEQKTFDWLKYSKNMFLDFYLPEYNCGIEFQGGQHFVPVKKGKMSESAAKENLRKCIERDKAKIELCKEHGVEVLYVVPEKYYENLQSFYTPNNTFQNINEVIDKIKAR